MKIDGKAKTVKAQLCLGIVAFVILLAPLTAAEPKNTAKKQPALPILIEPDQLQQKLSDKKLRVIDVRPEAEYTQGHIPGAVRVDVGDWKKTAFATNGLHDEKIWAKKIGPLGLAAGNAGCHLWQPTVRRGADLVVAELRGCEAGRNPQRRLAMVDKIRTADGNDHSKNIRHEIPTRFPKGPGS